MGNPCLQRHRTILKTSYMRKIASSGSGCAGIQSDHLHELKNNQGPNLHKQKDNKGPNTEPCATLQLTEAGEHFTLSILVTRQRPAWYDCSHVIAPYSKQYLRNLSI